VENDQNWVSGVLLGICSNSKSRNQASVRCVISSFCGLSIFLFRSNVILKFQSPPVSALLNLLCLFASLVSLEPVISIDSFLHSIMLRKNSKVQLFFSFGMDQGGFG
jgi:hypothetical protein